MSHFPHSKRIVLIGVGAIGRFEAAFIARDPSVGSLTLVDPDHYSLENLQSQAITLGEVGQAKVFATAASLHAIRPDLRIECFAARVETLPLGVFIDADAIVACVDSRRVRQTIQLLAWRCGKPLIDTGVNTDEHLTRVSCFIPSDDSPCMECSWDDTDYAITDQLFRCDGSPSAAAPTRSPAWLGAHAATLAAAELAKLLAGETDPASSGSDIISNLRSRSQFVTARNKNPRCRFDHQRLHILPLLHDPKRVSLGALLREKNASSLRVEPFDLATEAACSSCGGRIRLLVPATRLNIACAGCGAALRASGHGLREWISPEDVTREELDRPLSLTGILPGDVIRLRRSDGTELALHLTSPSA